MLVGYSRGGIVIFEVVECVFVKIGKFVYLIVFMLFDGVSM